MSPLRTLVVMLALLAPLGLGLAQGATTGGFGVSPVQLDFRDPTLLRGGVAEGSLRLQNRFAEATEVTIEPEGPIASWVTVDAGSPFTMAAGSSRTVLVRLLVPEAAANGDHAGALRIRATGTGEPTGSGAAVHVEVLPLVRARVGGEQTVRFDLEQATVRDRAPDAPIVVVADVVNSGNVRSAPALEIVVVDSGGAEALRETVEGPAMEPGAKQRVELATGDGLPKGLYTASVKLVDTLGGDTVPASGFEVRPGADAAPAAGAPSGALAGLKVEAASLDELASVTARFANDGRVDIAGAKLTVEIYRDGRRVDVVHSDPLRVPAGGAVDLEAFHHVEDVGEHVFVAYVTYDGIRSAAKEVELVVAPGASASGMVGETGSGSATRTEGAGEESASPKTAVEADAKGEPAATPVGGMALLALACVVAVGLRRRR